MLGFRLKGWNLLHQDNEICFFRKSQNEFKEFFSQENDLVFCDDVCSVTEVGGHQHDPPEWRLFIDSPKVSLKAVLLHNGNKFPSASLAHAANMKEYFENMKLLLEKTQYENHNWNICGDLKVTALLLGLQFCYTKVCCFLCEWDSYGQKTSLHRKTVA